MTSSRLAILAEARTRTRTLDSAPDPHGRVRAIHADLVRMEGWSKGEEAKIIAFGSWLAASVGRPAEGSLPDAADAAGLRRHRPAHTLFVRRVSPLDGRSVT